MLAAEFNVTPDGAGLGQVPSPEANETLVCSSPSLATRRILFKPVRKLTVSNPIDRHIAAQYMPGVNDSKMVAVLNPVVDVLMLAATNRLPGKELLFP
jgi:hypothetical protein